jgi:hypothetical protein
MHENKHNKKIRQGMREHDSKREENRKEKMARLSEAAKQAEDHPNEGKTIFNSQGREIQMSKSGSHSSPSQASRTKQLSIGNSN